MDSRGAESQGSSGSQRAHMPHGHPTQTRRQPQTTYADTRGAPTGPHNQTPGCETGTPARDSHAKPRTHKGAGRCWLLNPNPQKTHYREMHVFLQRPWRRRPTPTAPRQSLCLLKAVSPATPTLRCCGPVSRKS